MSGIARWRVHSPCQSITSCRSARGGARMSVECRDKRSVASTEPPEWNRIGRHHADRGAEHQYRSTVRDTDGQRSAVDRNPGGCGHPAHLQCKSLCPLHIEAISVALLAHPFIRLTLSFRLARGRVGILTYGPAGFRRNDQRGCASDPRASKGWPWKWSKTTTASARVRRVPREHCCQSRSRWCGRCASSGCNGGRSRASRLRALSLDNPRTAASRGEV